MSNRGWFALLAAGALALSTPEPARALPDQLLAAVVPYDLNGDRSLHALAELGKAERGSSAQDRTSARYVRALAYADLWLLGRVLHDDDVAGRVAKALATPEGDVPALLDRALAEAGADDRDLTDARVALAVSGTLPRFLGPRTAAVALTQIVAALSAEAPRDPLGALSELVADPCVEASSCTSGVLAQLDDQGRRAFTALTRAQEALDLVTHHGVDPFAAALPKLVDAAQSALGRVTLYPGRQLGNSAGAEVDHPEREAAFGAGRRVIITVTGTTFEVSTTASLVAGKGQSPRLDGPPVGFAEPLRVAVPRDLPPYMKAVPELATALRDVYSACPDCSVILSAHADAQGHLVTRALLSAHAAGRAAEAFVIAGSRPEAVRIVSTSAAEADARNGAYETRVTVRRGGFAVKRGSATTSLPRERRATGFAFDYAGLRKRLGGHSARPASLSFMPDVDAETLFTTAAVMGTSKAPLTVLIP